MYRSHLLESVEAADRMREAQARFQREIADEAEKLPERIPARRKTAGLFVPFKALTGYARRAAAGPSDR